LQLLTGADKEFKRKALYDWYQLMDIDRFSDLYPLSQTINYCIELAALRQWKESANILFTPTVFVNGNELPNHYSIYALPVYLNRMITEQTECVQRIENQLTEAKAI
jgi:hypothetical protein